MIISLIPFLQRIILLSVGFFACIRNYEDLKPVSAKTYVVPLVPKEVYDRYRDHQKKVEAKEKEIGEVISAEKERRAAALRPHLAEYMLASWQYENRPNSMATLTVEQFALEMKLQPDILDHWVKFLRPRAVSPSLKSLAASNSGFKSQAANPHGF